MDRAYKIVAIFLVCIIVLSFSGCRQRTTYPTPPSAETAQNQSENQEQEESTEGEQQDSPSEETSTEDPPDTTPETPTKIDAQDDSRVPEKVESPSDDSKQSNTENNPNSNETANTGNSDNGNNSVVVVDPSDDSGETTLDNDEGSKVKMIVDQYTDLLEKGVGTLYPCQVNNVYFETVTDYLTVGKGSTEHQVILDSGGLNIADMLSSNALNVNDAWVISNNPGAIIKCVDASVLGSTVHDTTAAAQAYSELCSRPGWDGLSAVTNGNVLLLSEELFKTDEGRLAAKLYIASTMYPTLFSNVDLNAYCTTVFGENCGMYVYTQ